MAVIKQRSPNYPGIDLNEAIEALKRLYPTVQRGAFTAIDAAKNLGYKSVSGPVRRKIGALKQYGLIEQKKGDNAKLSTRGLTICLRNPASDEYRAALKDAVLEPPFFREFYESGKHESSDDVLRQELIVKRGFTDEGAATFIQVLRSSLNLVNLTDSSTMSRPDEDVMAEDTERESTLSPQQRPGKRERVPLRLVGGAEVTIELPNNMTEASWKHMLRFLEVMKEGYVKDSNEVGVITETPAVTKSKLSPEGREILSRVNSGGVPMVMTPHLEKIAKDHGIYIDQNTTPNEIIAELRKLV